MAAVSQPRILPLSAEAISQIHASKHITSLQGVVLSLVGNSLDAGSTKVEITVDWVRGACTVDDNGLGIPAREFAENGGLCRMYCTSKRAPTGTIAWNAHGTHGSTGTFLSQLSSMSMLTITSTHAENVGPASMTMHQGKAIARQLPTHDLDGSSNQRCGTDIAVCDLFGNMPVRVKQRGFDSSLTGEDGKSWHELKRGIVGLLLAWPKPCTVRIRDSSDSSKVMNISAGPSAFSSTLTKRNLNQLGSATGKYDLRDALPVLFQSGFASPTSTSRWIPLSVSTSGLSLKGMVCLDPAPSKQCQFIALGITPCDPLSGHSDMFDVVNKVFANSSFGLAEDTRLEKSKGSPRRPDSHTVQELKSRKGIDRYPMFCFQLQFKDRSQDSVQLERLNESSLKAIMDVLEAASIAWLENNHFRPKKKQRRKNEMQDAPEATLASPSRPNSAMSLSSNTSPARLAGVSSTKRSAPQHDRAVYAQGQGQRFSEGFNTLEGDLYGLSRIRAGTVRPRSAGADIPKRAWQNAGIGRLQGSNTDTDTKPFKHKKTKLLDAKGVEAAGAWRTPTTSYRHEDVPQRPATSDCTPRGASLRPTDPSSEDFGSFDEADAIEAVQGFETAQDIAADSYSTNTQSSDKGIVTWTDPVSGQTYRVNSRTGVVLPLISAQQESRGSEGLPSRQRAGIDTRLSSAGKPLSLSRRKTVNDKENQDSTESGDQKWLPGFLKEWKNPVFAAQSEDRIPVASNNGPGLLEVNDQGNHCSHTGHAQNPSGELPSTGIKLSKAALKHTRVIRQVDEKFVLCKIPDSEGLSTKEHGEVLLLVDQHAASERVILESLLEGLCTPAATSNETDEANNTIATTYLATDTAKGKALVFEVSSQEYELFQRHQQHFAIWGMVYDLVTSSPEPSKTYYRLVVRYLPSVIAERCANFPSLCIELMRTEVWELAEGAKRSSTALPPNPSWMTLLPLLPSGMRDMLYSRSCRSAIMFNDVLNQGECQELLENLSRCVFPFICAHGRVSMVPLVELGNHPMAGISEVTTKGSSLKLADSKGFVMDREDICSSEKLKDWMMAFQKQSGATGNDRE